MSFENIYIVSDKRRLITPEEIEQAETHFGIKFPPDYWLFLQTLGAGSYGGFVDIFAPNSVFERHEMMQKHFAEYFFYDKNNSALTQEQVSKSKFVAFTIDGDEIVFYPHDKKGFYVLPRNLEEIYFLGASLADVFNWFDSSGIIVKPAKFRWFCPSKNRAYLHLGSESGVDALQICDWVKSAFGAQEMESDADLLDRESFRLFCRAIGGYAHISDDSVGFRYDGDFEDRVFRTATEYLVPLGFEVLEHYPAKR